MKRYLTYLSYALTALGLGLVVACGFGVQGTTRWLAGGGLAMVAVGGALLFALKGRDIRGSVQNWKGPAAVLFVIGAPALIGLAVFAYMHA